MAKQKPVTTGRKQVAADKTAKKQPAKEFDLDRQRGCGEMLSARNRERPERPESVIIRTERKDGSGGSNTLIEPAQDQDPEFFRAAMLEAFGTRSTAFLSDTMNNIIRVISPSCNVTDQQYNAAVARLAAVEPQNELEATLAAQMVAANECAMRCMRSMVGTDNADHHKMYGDMANKFLRTFAAQVEALSKLRRGGEQVVKHVYVQEGGQAVIAGTVNNNTGGRGNFESSGQPYGTSPAPPRASLLSPDASGNGVPIPSDAERALSDSRGQVTRPAAGES